MIRNSTSKYKEKYQRSNSKTAQTTALLPWETKTSIEHFSYTVATLPNVPRTSSSKKLEKAKVLHDKNIQISKFKMTDTFTEIKLTKTFKSKVRESKKVKEQTVLRSETGDGEKSEAKTVNKQFRQRDSQQFIEKMAKNTLFYCTNCFVYVFDIEKSRHWPDCKDAVSERERKELDFYKKALRKLERIEQLSRYTNTKEVEVGILYNCFLRGELDQVQKIEFPQTYQFFKLDEIEMAFAHVYCKLLRGRTSQVESGLFTCY